MPLRQLQAPALPPVAFALAKGYLRVDHDEDDLVIALSLETQRRASSTARKANSAGPW
jgi:hypothetical protein